ncbi:MAG: response regulator, partial [Clostridia bacterium]
MYKVLVVDDEADVREGVLQEMEWQTHGFEVAGIAENGKEAQELAERLRPDLIVTDIKMPFLDGLQLAAWCKETMPAVRIIILTGFDEFDYAQRALKLHIDEYVLKPFSAGELLEAMLKVKVRLDEERAQKETMQQLQEAYQKSLPILRDAFLSSLVSRVYAEEEVLQKAGHYGLNLQAEAYVVAVACVDHPPEGEWELSLFAVQKIAAELLEKSMRTFSFLYHDSVVLLFCVDCGYEEAAWQPIMSNLADICLNVEKFYRFTITIGVGTSAANPARLRDSYQAAVQALDYRAIVGMNRVICINDVEQRKGDRIQFDEHMEQELVRCLKVGTHTELLKLIDELFGQCAQARVSIKEFQ